MFSLAKSDIFSNIKPRCSFKYVDFINQHTTLSDFSESVWLYKFFLKLVARLSLG